MFLVRLQIEVDLLDVAVERIAVVVANGQAHVIAQEHTALSKCLDMLQVDDVRTMNSHKIARRQNRLDILQAQQRHHNLTRIEVQAQILALALDIVYIADLHQYYLMIGLH